MKLSTLSKIYLYIIVFIPNSVAILNVPGIPLISVNRMYIFFWILVFFSYLLISKKPRRKLDYPFPSPVIVLMTSFFFVSIFSPLFKSSMQYSISILLEIFIPSFIIWNSFFNENDMMNILSTMFYIFIGFALYGIITDAVSFNPVIEIIEKYFSTGGRKLVHTYSNKARLGELGRAQSIFPHPFLFGYLCSVMILYAWYFYYHQKSIQKKGFIVYFIMLAYAILATTSRTPILFLLSAGGVYWFLQKFIQKLKALFFVMLFSLGLIAFFPYLSQFNTTELFFSIFEELLGQKSTIEGSSMVLRLHQFEISKSIFFQSPIFGHGLTMVRKLVETGSVNGLHGAESFIFVLLIDTGVVGVLAYLFFYTSIIAYFGKRRSLALDSNSFHLANIMICIIIGHLFFIVASGDLGSFKYLMLFITITARYLHLQRQAEKRLNGMNDWKLSQRQQ